MDKFKKNQVVKIDGFAMGMIKELPSGIDKRYLVSIGCDLRRVDEKRITAIVTGTGSIKKDEIRKG